MMIVAPHLSRDSGGLIDLDEIESRCAGAIRLAFKSKEYGNDVRDHARAELVMLVWERMPKDILYGASRRMRTSLVGGKVTYSKKRAAKSKDALDGMVTRAAFPREYVPSFKRLTLEAYNLRRAYDQRRAYEAAAAPVEFDATMPDAYEGGRTHDVTMRQARRMALDLLDGLGYRPLRKGDLPLYALAYTAARYNTLHGLGYRANGEHGEGLTIGAQIADELGMTPAYYRKSLQRAVERMPRFRRYAYAVALDLADSGGIALKPSRSRTVASDLERKPRVKPEREAPVSTRSQAPSEAVMPAWTQTLSETQSARMAALAKLSVGKAARERKAAEERAIIRQQAADDAAADARQRAASTNV
jgi:hypothetical protein